MQNLAKDFICKNPKFLAFKQMFPIKSFVITAYSDCGAWAGLTLSNKCSRNSIKVTANNPFL